MTKRKGPEICSFFFFELPRQEISETFTLLAGISKRNETEVALGELIMKSAEASEMNSRVKVCINTSI